MHCVRMAFQPARNRKAHSQMNMLRALSITGFLSSVLIESLLIASLLIAGFMPLELIFADEPTLRDSDWVVRDTETVTSKHIVLNGI